MIVHHCQPLPAPTHGAEGKYCITESNHVHHQHHGRIIHDHARKGVGAPEPRTCTNTMFVCCACGTFCRMCGVLLSSLSIHTSILLPFLSQAVCYIVFSSSIMRSFVVSVDIIQFACDECCASSFGLVRIRLQKCWPRCTRHEACVEMTGSWM